MIFETCAVKDNLRYASGLSALGDKGSDFDGLLHLRALGVALHRRLKGRGCCQGLPGCVINDLGVDVVQAAEDREARSCC